LVVELGAGSDGETLAFNPDDGLLYHASGIGIPNNPNGEKFETIDPDTLVVTNVPLSGFDYEELTVLTFLDGGFFAGDLGDAAVDMPDFFRITIGGAVTFLGNMDHVSKGLVPKSEPTPTPTPPTPTPPAAVDHYKVYNLSPSPTPTPGPSPIPTPGTISVSLEDQFGQTVVDLDALVGWAAPVSKAIAPTLPSLGDLLRPDEHLAAYVFTAPDIQPTRAVEVTNQFGANQLMSVKNGASLLVPAIKDSQGEFTLNQHWKCYDAFGQSPGVFVNLVDQFHSEPNVVVGPALSLCNPVEKNNEGPPPSPTQHLVCYFITDDPLGESHSLDDQFGKHSNLLVADPVRLCVPSLKVNLPEPSVLISIGPGLILLAWLDRQRRRRASGRRASLPSWG
jgi:hypothetical protein